MCMFEMEHTHEVSIARRLGVQNLRWWDKISYGGGASCATIMHACAAIATGLADGRRLPPRAQPRREDLAAVVAGEGPGDRRQGAARAVGPDPPGRRDRHVGAPPHARVRHHARAPRQRRHRGAQARAAQPLRDDARPAARHADLPERAASSAIRCTSTTAASRPTARSPASSPRSSAPATCKQKPALVHSVAQASGPNPVHLANYNTPDMQTTSVPCAELLWARSRAQAEGHGLRADLRRLHAAGDHRPRGLRLLQARRGRPVHRGRPHRARRRAAGAHLRRRPLGSLRARLQPDPRRRAPDPRHVDSQVPGCKATLVTGASGVATSAMVLRGE